MTDHDNRAPEHPDDRLRWDDFDSADAEAITKLIRDFSTLRIEIRQPVANMLMELAGPPAEPAISSREILARLGDALVTVGSAILAQRQIDVQIPVDEEGVVAHAGAPSDADLSDFVKVD